jgi:hypothetical protein
MPSKAAVAGWLALMTTACAPHVKTMNDPGFPPLALSEEVPLTCDSDAAQVLIGQAASRDVIDKAGRLAETSNVRILAENEEPIVFGDTPRERAELFIFEDGAHRIVRLRCYGELFRPSPTRP